MTTEVPPRSLTTVARALRLATREHDLLIAAGRDTQARLLSIQTGINEVNDRMVALTKELLAAARQEPTS